ncbi:MAG: 1-acyl-sn-glycerol-3-phosphate acyltransferase [Burkholderiaceae bacterium]
MFGEISLPLWIFIILLLGAAITVFQYAIYPLIAAYLNTRSRMVIEEVSPRLQLKLSQFSLTRRHVLADRLASDDQVVAALDDFAAAKGLSREQIRRETWRMAWDIVPAFNPYFYFRVGYRMARACLTALYRVRVAFADEASLAEVSTDDAVVFIINHRSNLDYAVANYLTARRTILSFGVGEWSRIWPIQPVMRMAGGYFVRRNSGDPHYRLLLKRYVQLATQAHVPHAIFIEGQLSNDGSVSPPRIGLVSYITEDFDPRRYGDIVFIPVGLNYDWVLEDVNVTRFQSADFQAKGRVYVLWQAARFLVRVVRDLVRRQQRFGLHCSHFGRPISFRRWLAARDVDWRELDRSARYREISALGERLHDDLSTLVPATPMTVLCRIWFDTPGFSGTQADVHERFEALVRTLRERGCHVELRHGRDGSDDTRRSLDHALAIALKRRLLQRGPDGRISLVSANAALVNYYGNSVSQFLDYEAAPDRRSG